MDRRGAPDFISDLPTAIIETILVLLPIRDAVRTSVLSSKWRYKWAYLPQLVFDDSCVDFSNDRALVEQNLIKFIHRVLLLHDGPVHKFKLSTSYLQSRPDIDQWILFLSRKDLKDLTLELGDGEFSRMPSCLFSCQQLMQLELFRCELDPPSSFQGFSCLRTLTLHQVSAGPDAVESLISSCPLLENLTLTYLDCLVLNICAPNLKYLCLEGEFKDICLDKTPSLSVMIVLLYMTEERVEQSSSCNFIKFLGGAPSLERLAGHIYFTKFLSIGNDLGTLPVTYNHLKIIELNQVSFDDMNEILVVLRLIMHSPNLEELEILGSSNISTAIEAPDLDFWETERLSNCTFKRLRIVKMMDISDVPHEMKFIEFLLEKSPVLETMIITPCVSFTNGRMNTLIELLRFRRASALSEIKFVQN